MLPIQPSRLVSQSFVVLLHLSTGHRRDCSACLTGQLSPECGQHSMQHSCSVRSTSVERIYWLRMCGTTTPYHGCLHWQHTQCDKLACSAWHPSACCSKDAWSVQHACYIYAAWMPVLSCRLAKSSIDVSNVQLHHLHCLAITYSLWVESMPVLSSTVALCTIDTCTVQHGQRHCSTFLQKRHLHCKAC